MSRNNIESDRRSAVSSFYGGRKSSMDMLNQEPGVHDAASGSRHDRERDDASSFYGMQRGGEQARSSSDMLVGQRPPYGQSAGYNRNSYFHVGREAPVKGMDEDEDEFMGSRRDLGAAPGTPGKQGDEEAGWNVFADFNNFGPRYSTAFTKYDDGYQQLTPESAQTPPPTKVENSAMSTTSGAPVELVTVPALGPEWKKSEMEAMTKKGRKKKSDGHRMDNYRAWKRDQRGCCGKYGTRKQIAIGLFLICIIIGLVLVFTIPRVPTVNFNSSSPLLNGTGSPATLFSRSPANFSFSAQLDLNADTGSSFVPIHFNHIKATVKDLSSNQKVAEGSTSLTVPAKTFREFEIPLNFTYTATNDTDLTWLDFYNACKNKALYADGNRPGVNLEVELSMSITGLIGEKKRTAQVGNVACPVELAQNAG